MDIYEELVLKIIKFLLNIGSQWVKSNYMSMLRDYFGKSTGSLQHYFRKSLSFICH